jgi:hypothetical protein
MSPSDLTSTADAGKAIDIAKTIQKFIFICFRSPSAETHVPLWFSVLGKL